jgi:predicted alpha/beta-hydrolase family hydrolase
MEYLHRELTERRFLTLLFNFPFAEAKKRRPDPVQVLRRTYRAAIGALARDPTAAPAHLFLGGAGLGGQTAAELAGSRVRIDGLFLLGYPLHPQGKPEAVKAEELFRVVSPSLFIQGTRDRRCDLDVLRRTLARVGAPTSLHVCQEADHQFKVLKKSGRTPDEVYEELLGSSPRWAKPATCTSTRWPWARWRTWPTWSAACLRGKRCWWTRRGPSTRCSIGPRPTA